MNRTYKQKDRCYTTVFPFPGITVCEVISPANQMGEMILHVIDFIHLSPNQKHKILDKMRNQMVLTVDQNQVFPDLETLFIRLVKIEAVSNKKVEIHE